MYKNFKLKINSNKNGSIEKIICMDRQLYSHIFTNIKTGEEIYICQIYNHSYRPTNIYLSRDKNGVVDDILRRPKESKFWKLTSEGEMMKEENWGNC